MVPPFWKERRAQASYRLDRVVRGVRCRGVSISSSAACCDGLRGFSDLDSSLVGACSRLRYSFFFPVEFGSQIPMAELSVLFGCTPLGKTSWFCAWGSFWPLPLPAFSKTRRAVNSLVLAISDFKKCFFFFGRRDAPRRGLPAREFSWQILSDARSGSSRARVRAHSPRPTRRGSFPVGHAQLANSGSVMFFL